MTPSAVSTLLFLFLLSGNTSFVEQDIPGLHVAGVDPLSGAARGNFRAADMDGDGAADLLLPGEMALQRNGAFQSQNRVPLPLDSPAEEQGAVACDVWEDLVALRYPRRLVMARWRENDWEVVLQQDIKWPVERVSPGESGQIDVRFQRFLHDFEGDGKVELVAASQKGLHVYSRESEFFEERACLEVFPGPRPTPLSRAHPPWGQARQLSGRGELWPFNAPETRYPPEGMQCAFRLDEDGVETIWREALPQGMVRFHLARFSLDASDGYRTEEADGGSSVTQPLPGYLSPCRLNDDESTDFAGGRFRVTSTSVLPTPLYETCASTDGGKTCFSVRSKSFVPRCSFVDFDGDGRLDMVAHRTGLFDGGLRETAARFSSRNRVSHDIMIHRQRNSGDFSKTPDFRGRFTLELAGLLAADNSTRDQYQSGGLIDVTGDFNGDGIRDVLMRDRPERLALYLSSRSGFGTRPAATIRIGGEWRFAVADIDGDGLSDIVVRWVPGETDAPEGAAFRSRIFLVREGL